MTLATVPAFVEALQESHLLDAPQLDELGELGNRFPEPDALAQELVRREWLTRFQVEQLKQGRGQGLLLGPYVLLELLGEGGMGQVFKARHRLMGRVVALKTIRKERLVNDQSVRRFYREVQAVSRLAHANIVLAYDAAQAGDTHFFAMEFVDGMDLAGLVKQQGPLAIEQACECVRQAALGLQHAHKHSMVHRDIKPHNLIVGADGVVKILDMGLARLNQLGEGETDSSLTEAGSIMGTPDYIAPEQAMSSHEVDIRADIYSLGCTFYYLLTGQTVFPGGRPLEKLMKHQMEEPRLAETLRPDLPPAVAGILRRMIAKRLTDRYQTPAEVADALAPYCGAVSGVAASAAGHLLDQSASSGKIRSSADETIPAWSSSAPSRDHKVTEIFRPSRVPARRRWLVAAGLAAVLLLLALFTVLVIRPFDREQEDGKTPIALGPQDKKGPSPDPKRPDQAPEPKVGPRAVAPGVLPPPGAVRVLVDASKDGGVWWAPQGKNGFDPNKPHQGSKLAAYLKGLGYTVRELPRGMGDMSAELKGANLVIRAGDFLPHTKAEVEAYKTFVQEGGNLFLVAGYRDFISRPDPLAEGFGLQFAKTVRNAQVERWGSHPAVSDLPPLRFGIGSLIAKWPTSAVPLGWLGKNENLSITGDAMVFGMMDYGKGRVIFLSSQLLLQDVPQPLTERLLTLLAVDVAQAAPPRPLAAVKIGQPLELAGPTVQGDRFELTKWQGKVVLVDFWATWCRPCVAEMPNVLRVYQRYHQDGLEVVGVNMDNGRETLTRFLKGKDLPWPQIFFDEPGKTGWQNPLCQQFGVKGIPFTILIDRDGKVTQVDVRDRALELGVAKLLGRQPASPEEMEKELAQIIEAKFAPARQP